MDKIQIIENLFYNILVYSFLVPLGSFFFYKKIKSEAGFFIIIFYSVLFFLLNIFFPFFDSRGTLKLYYSVYTFLEYTSFTLLFYLKIKTKIFKFLIITLTILFIAFQIFHYYNIKDREIDSLPIGVETILLFTYIIFYFYEQFKQPNVDYIYKNHVFWIAFGVMIYLGGSFFFYLLANYMSTIRQYWDLTYIGDVLKNIIFLYSLIVLKRSISKDSSHSKKNIPYLDMDFT